MKRVHLFLSVFGVSIALLLLVIVWYLISYETGYSSMYGMMGQMMGGQYSGSMPSPMPGYVWWSIIVLVPIVIAGVGGLAYYLAFPEIKLRSKANETLQTAPKTDTQTLSWAMLIRTSKPDERKVLEVLAAHDGKYLQKFIVKETGLSKLRTHRIVSRFAERGIVTVAKSGNTNEVGLAEWLSKSPK